MINTLAVPEQHTSHDYSDPVSVGSAVRLELSFNWLYLHEGDDVMGFVVYHSSLSQTRLSASNDS